MSSTDLTYANPPICEVSYSLQFEPLDGFHLGHIGLVWGKFMNSYPSVERAEMLNHEIERFGAARPPENRPRLQLLDSAPLPRILMAAANGGSVIQVQKDRFVYNWRKQDPQESYPRFDQLKQQFELELNKFEGFIEEFTLGNLTYNQIEVTNVNQIPSAGMSVQDVFQGLSCGIDTLSNLTNESLGFKIRHIILDDSNNPIGRLYTIIEKAVRVVDGTEIFVLTFTARANPVGSDKESAMRTLELLRDTINKSFQNMIVEKLQTQWGKGK